MILSDPPAKVCGKASGSTKPRMLPAYPTLHVLIEINVRSMSSFRRYDVTQYNFTWVYNVKKI